MYTPVRTSQFKKDIKLAQKRNKDFSKIKQVMEILILGESLPLRYKDHALIGNYRNRRECHVEPDWLLIYKLQDGQIIFERTGSHADLFK